MLRKEEGFRGNQKDLDSFLKVRFLKRKRLMGMNEKCLLIEAGRESS